MLRQSVKLFLFPMIFYAVTFILGNCTEIRWPVIADLFGLCAGLKDLNLRM